ncbi:Aminopeptidase N [Aphelenchoides besseyi]|nr:Aminopeptidase N [Aphelenchoides besseyi]
MRLFFANGISRKTKELVQSRRQTRNIFKKHPKFDADPLETSDSLPHVCDVLRYELQLSPYFQFPGYTGRDDLTFDGFVNITFEITKNTQYLPLRMDYLTVIDMFLWHNGEKLTISSLKNDPETSHFKLRPIKDFVVGDKYTLSINYGGFINNKDKGRGSWAGLTYDIYTLPDTSKRYAISTFLRPTFARELFPSLDDPSFKSVFSLKLIYPKNAKAYHNSVEESTDVYDDQRWITKFKDTPLLSTYRLAIVIGDFKNVTMIADAGYPVSTLAFPHWINGISRTTEIATKCANTFAQLTNVPYPLDKLDFAAFTFLAEYELSDSFGLISGSQELLLISPKFFDRTETFDNALSICSAVVGQQFGGSVTQKRWGMEFLTRGFTHFYNIRSYSQQLPAVDRDIFEIYAFSSVDEGLMATNNSGHSLVDNQLHFDDQVEYAGPAVIGMIEQVVGRKVFHKATERYLNKNKFGNADLETMIDAFEKATKNQPLCGDQLRIREFMTDFLLQPNYPLVTIHYNESEGYTFEQQSSMGWNDTTTWNIPLFVLNVNTQKVHTLWLLKSGEICSSIDLNSTDTYIFNYRGLTFARVLYDEVIWTTKFLNVDWTQVDDASPIALIVDRFEEESWTQKDSLAKQLINKIVDDFDALINPYLVSIVLDLNDQDLEDRLFININWYPKTLSDEFQNYNLMLLAILDGYSDYQQVGLLKFKNFMSDCAQFETELETCNKIPPNVRLGVYCAGIIDRDPNSLDFFYDYADFVGTQSEFYPYLWPEFNRAEEALSYDTSNGFESRRAKLKHRKRTTRNV